MSAVPPERWDARPSHRASSRLLRRMRASVRFAYIASRCAAECCGNASPSGTDESSSQRMSGCCSSALSEASVSASKSAAYCASGMGSTASTPTPSARAVCATSRSAPCAMPTIMRNSVSGSSARSCWTKPVTASRRRERSSGSRSLCPDTPTMNGEFTICGGSGKFKVPRVSGPDPAALCGRCPPGHNAWRLTETLPAGAPTEHALFPVLWPLRRPVNRTLRRTRA